MTTSRKEMLETIWSECFDDTKEWIDMYFNTVYNDRDALLLMKNGVGVSSMLLLRYNLNLWGCDVPVGYISGAATLPHFRNRGYMRELMMRAIREAYERGDFMMALIPASRELYFYYDRFDFSTLFYAKEEHYTSLHKFHPEKVYTNETDIDINTLYRKFHELEKRQNGRMLHGFNDLKAIFADIKIDGGGWKVLKNEEGDLVSIAFYHRGDGGEIIVKDILARTDDAITGALSLIRKDNPGMSITHNVRPADDDMIVEARGMGRIVNVLGLLKVIAGVDWDTHGQYIKVSDDIIEENNHIFHIAGREVEVCDDYEGKLDIDVDIKTLAGILFNTPATRSLFHLPTQRLFMSLMLE